MSNPASQKQNPPQKIPPPKIKRTQLPPKKKTDPVKMALQALAILVLYEKKRMEETKNIEKENDKDE